MRRTRGIPIAGILILLILTGFLLGTDAVPFWKWYMALLSLGILMFPVTVYLFSGFEDRGWVFARVLGIAFCGFIMWVASGAHFLKFSTFNSLILTGVSGMIVWSLAGKNMREESRKISWELVLWEELLFLLFFLFWTYLSGCRPEAHGTEKYMDYGFMAAMMRSDYLPARDIWYSQDTINYYYGGQYYAVWLTKLTGTDVKQTYHLMRSVVAGFGFILPFSIGFHLIQGLQGIKKRKNRGWSFLTGIASGVAVSLAGNMHYVVYGLIQPLLQRYLGMNFTEKYWFPDSTRYIGYNPDTSDKTIHEFPSYSFVLGDLHAHMINVMYVLTVSALIFSWIRNVRRKEKEGQLKRKKDFLKEILLQPELLVLSFFLGLFQWTNYWDFVIYFVVVGAGIVYTKLYQYPGEWSRIFPGIVLQVVEMMAVSVITALPFTASFDTMVSGVALAENHSRFYQLLILWGLPVLTVLIFFIWIFMQYWRAKIPKKDFTAFFLWIQESDVVSLIFGLCGTGLVLIPELVYVRDIYEQGYARSNTMFKLTYQAYILLAMAMIYILIRLLVYQKKKILKLLSGVGMLCFLATCGYFPNAVYSWFGNIGENYQGLDATAFLESKYPDDASAIRWLQEHVEGTPVVLEANGDSYSEYCRVSAMTGLPTVLGWYVHEWLWRGDPQDLNMLAADVETIYTGEDPAETVRLLRQYEVSYIFIGSMERTKYPDLQEGLLRQMGEVVFEDSSSDTCVIALETY